MLFNDPKTFREDMLAGYAAAFPEYLIEVPGGVARATETPKGKVAVMNGGGSGHYPAFCGIIGEGFMDATVVGNVFTSPSTDDVYNVAKSVENGSGIFIIGGNYAGDKMNFNLARDRLIEEGIDARTFYITDDVASAKKDEIEKRRGNVGTFSVFKVAGAASAAGKSFDEVEALTIHANDFTRTMSVGFKGCTMPGAKEPLFHVPEGKMEVGQGIHGEAGVYESELVSAEEIAKLLVERVLDEKPEGAGNRVGVILDGLGSTKYEELFVVWKTVAALFKEKGYELVKPMVGEFVTSLDMAGIALAVTFLDEELEEYWLAPADTPSFKCGNVQKNAGARRVVTAADAGVKYEKGSEAAVKAAEIFFEGLEKAKKAVVENEEKLAAIDAIAGDGDHGRGMVKGLTFAVEAAEEAKKAGAGVGTVVAAAGNAWASKAGGTSGILWGEGLKAAGKVLGDDKEGYPAELIPAAVKAVADRMMELGHAKLGDKTMLDTLIPFIDTLKAAVDGGKGLYDAWSAAADAADKAADETRKLTPKIGRARPQAERSLGNPDAGAVSMAMCIRAAL